MNTRDDRSQGREGAIHGLSGAYVTDALDDLERARFEAHLTRCEDCRAEVDELHETAALLAGLDQAPPPPALRNRVLADIRRVRPLPPERDDTADSTGAAGPTGTSTGIRSARPRRLVRWLAAAAAVLVVVGGGAVAIQSWQHDAGHTQVSAVDQVLRADDAQRVSVRLPDGAHATLVRSVAQRRAVLVTHGIRTAPHGKVYELWLEDPAGRMQPAGLMSRGGDRAVLLRGDAATARAAGITVEPAGGSPQPTSKPIALFDLSRKT